MHTKYILLFCCLIALTHSKLPKNSFQSFLESFSSVNEIEDPCYKEEDKDKCVVIPTKDTSTQCCYINLVNRFDDGDYKGNEECVLFLKPTTGLANIQKAKQFQPLLREIGGFTKYRGELLPPLSLFLHCNDGDFSVSNLNEIYNSDEIKTFTSGKHCLNDTASIFENEAQQESFIDCKDRELLKSAKDADIECGNLDFTMINGIKTKKLKTCIPFAYDMFSKLEMPEFLNTVIKEAIQDEHYEKVIVELSDSKGRKIMYDSDTGKINISSSSSILTISKYLLLLSLFLL